jgi:hypothetical protein
MALYLVSVYRSHSTWIYTMEIIRLVLEVSMLGHYVWQTSHFFISVCWDTWRTWWKGQIMDIRWTHALHHRWCCSCMDQSWKCMESCTCCFKLSLLVHGQCSSLFWTACCLSMYIMSRCTLKTSRTPFLCTLCISSVKIISFHLCISLSFPFHPS